MLIFLIHYFIVFTGHWLHDVIVSVSNKSYPYTTLPLAGPNYVTCAQYDGAVPLGATITLTCTQPAIGQYVSVYIPSNEAILTLCEVEVYGTLSKFVASRGISLDCLENLVIDAIGCQLS